MSNDDRPITLFNLYYYGTDRWGAWPFLVAQLVRRLTGFQWSDQSLSAMQTSWLFVGALVIAGLSRKDSLLVGVAFLFTLCLHGETRYQIFWLSQVYAWQLTAVLISWYSLRRLFDNDPGDANHRRWKRAGWMFLAFCFSYLAIWSSAASIPFLLFIVCVEILRAQLKRAGQTQSRSFVKSAVRGFIPVVLAALAERIQKFDYHRHALKHYGADFRTRFEIDTGYLTKNLSVQLNQIINLSWWPLHLLATLAVLAVICALIYAWLKKRTELMKELRRIFSDDTAILIIGCYGIAVINFALAVVVSHVRINQYEDRYLTFTSLFGPVAGILILFLILKMYVPRPVGRFIKPLLVVTGLVLLTARFPVPGNRHEYQIFKETALALSQKSPRGILLGDYWGTYVFTALQPVNAMTPVPLEGKENRMPWTREMVRQADRVVVEYRHSRLGEAGHPPQHLSQYGNSLRLAEPNWYENGDYSFALYIKDN
jgi:hypothetical protein